MVTSALSVHWLGKLYFTLCDCTLEGHLAPLGGSLGSFGMVTSVFAIVSDAGALCAVVLLQSLMHLVTSLCSGAGGYFFRDVWLWWGRQSTAKM